MEKRVINSFFFIKKNTNLNTLPKNHIFICMETKYCKKCGEHKPITEFHESQNSLLCKYHHNEEGRNRKKLYRLNPKNKEKERLKYHERRVRLWANTLLSSTRGRKCENDLTVDDIIELFNKQEGKCFWFKLPLLPTTLKKHPQKPSLDRIDRLKGYTKENVVLSCYAANIGRNETPIDIWVDFLDVLFNGGNKTENTINDEFTELSKKIDEIDDRDEFVIYDEDLNHVVVKNLKQYSIENNISMNTLMGCRKKINRNSQKGLIILNRSKKESVEKRVYLVTSPNGEKFQVNSLRKFCIEKNLNDSALHRVGKGEIRHYKGWKCEYIIKTLN
jgi:hypothetical protein